MKFDREDTASDMKDQLIRYCIANKGLKIFVEQLFSKQLQSRRTNAVRQKKELIGSKVLLRGKVVYPAVLMGQYEVDMPYKKVQEF